MSSVGEEMPKEMARIRDVMIPAYQEVGIGGQPGIILMRASLDRAAKALASGDVIEILSSYEDLRSWKL